MIKAFLFDYDGVITEGANNDNLSIRLSRNIGVSLEEATDMIKSVWNDFSTGRLSEDMAWQKIEEQYGKSIKESQRNIWFEWNELKPLDSMLELVNALKQRGYVVGLLSNIFPVTAELIRKNGGYNYFDFLVLSCDAGERKPNSKIYEIAMANLPGIHPDEVIFLDDTIRCVDAANKFGIKSIHVIKHEDAINEVYEMIGA